MHLRVLKQGFLSYFEDLSDKNFKLARNLFDVVVDSIQPAEQEEFIELINHSNAKDKFAEIYLFPFWCKMFKLYPNVSKIVIRILMRIYACSDKNKTQKPTVCRRGYAMWNF